MKKVDFVTIPKIKRAKICYGELQLITKDWW